MSEQSFLLTELRIVFSNIMKLFVQANVYKDIEINCYIKINPYIKIEILNFRNSKKISIPSWL